MEFGLSEEQVLLTDTLRRFLAERAPLDRVRRFAESPDGGDVWKDLTELGIPGLLIDEAAGGLSLSMLDAAVVAETFGANVTPAPYLGSAVAAPLAAAGQDTLLADLAAGRTRVGLALAEACGARGDAGVRYENGGLHGTSLFVIDYPADHYLIADDRQRLHLVAANAPGLTGSRLTTVDRTRPTGELKLADTPGVLLADDPRVLARVLDACRVMLAADTLGAAQTMLTRAIDYAGERQQFGRPIGSFQAVKHMCAEMAAALEPCRAMVWYAAHALDHLPGDAHVYACQSKAHLAEVGQFVARTATEVHGGMGFTDLLGLHFWFKRIGYNRQMLGTPERLRETAARAQQICA